VKPLAILQDAIYVFQQFNQGLVETVSDKRIQHKANENAAEIVDS